MQTMLPTPAYQRVMLECTVGPPFPCMTSLLHIQIAVIPPGL
jgi:hypothetical protein